MDGLKPIPKEAKYVDLDEETGLWCVFGVDSGYAYSSHADEGDAYIALADSEPLDPSFIPYEVEEEFTCEMGYKDCEERGFCNGDC